MGAYRTYSIPVALSAAAALLSACGSSVTVERSAEIARPAATTFTYLATTPSNSPFGEGTITVTGASDNMVRADLTVGETTVPVEFAIEPAGEGVTVTASAVRETGGNPFAQDTISPVLEAGLAALKGETEALGAFDFGNLKFDVVDTPARPFLYIEAETPNDSASVKLGVLQAMSIVDAQIRANNLTPDGAPVAVETMWDDARGRYAFQAGRPFTGTPPGFLIAVKSGQTPGGQAVRVIYEGPEDSVIPTYDQIETLIAAGRLQTTTPKSFEVYLDDPTQPGGSVRREIYHVVQGDARRLEALFPSNRPPALPAPAPAPTANAPAATQPAAVTPPPAQPGEPQPIAPAPQPATP